MQELVLAAQRGCPEAITTLWEKVQRLAFSVANKYTAAAAYASVSQEDLNQCAALGVMEALRGYIPEKGAFTTYLVYHVRNACRCCLGLFSNPDMIPTISLDTPLGKDTEPLTLADTIPDESAFQALEYAEAALDNQKLREVIDAALNSLPNDIAVTIRLHDLEGMTLQESADKQGIHRNTARTRRRMGFSHLRKSQELQDWYIPNYYRHKGLASFRSTWSSVVEDEVIKLDENRSKQ